MDCSGWYCAGSLFKPIEATLLMRGWFQWNNRSVTMALAVNGE